MAVRKSLKSLFKPHLAALNAYTAVEPPEVLAQRYGVPLDKVAKLDANENPYGPSPSLAKALADQKGYSIYPDPLQRNVREALAAYTNTTPDRVIAGAGCDELIDLLVRLIVGPRDSVIDLPPTFGMYAVATHLEAGNVVTVPRNELFDVDVDAIRRRVHDRTKIIFLCNPNNPTGNLTPESTIRQLAELGPLLVVDETYHEFCGFTAAGLLDEFENLVVLRSLSKWAGLAGMRLGYGIMSPELVHQLMVIKQPYNISVASEVALFASLDDTDTLLQRVRTIVEERERMVAQMKKQRGIRVFPSKGNFLICRLTTKPAQQVHLELAKRGLFVRYFNTEPLKDCLRITVGLPEHTDRLAAALREILEK